MREYALRSSQFRAEREATWRELEALLERSDSQGIATLDAAEILRLAVLYRHAVGSLATARAISLDRNVIDYLDALVARAHLRVYGFHQGPAAAVSEFVGRTFPRAVRRFWPQCAACLAILIASIAGGATLVSRDVDRYYDIVSPAEAEGRTPAATTEELRRVLYRTSGGEAFELQAFAAFLFTHNAQVGLLCAASGIAAGAPVPYLIATSGLELGAMDALYRSRGLGVEFWAWILPHGITEMLALVLCAGAGLAIGTAIVFPGERSRRAAVAETGRAASDLVLGACAMFLVAGLIEGIFRQSVQAPGIRWAVAAATALSWIGYFSLAGRGHGRDLA